MDKNKFLLSSYFFLVFIPLLLGAVIYIFFRDDNSIIINKILYEYCQFNYLVILKKILNENIKISYFTKYSLPDGLWLFAFGNCLMLNKFYYFFHFKNYTNIFLIVLSIEFMQANPYFNFGTFDFNDIYAYAIAYFFSSIICYNNYKKCLKNNNWE